MPDDDDLDGGRHLSGASGILHSSNNNHHLTSSQHMSNVGANNRSGFGGGSHVGGGGGGGGGFQLQINGRSPLDALAMLHLERCAHRETRKELNQLRKKYELLRDEFDSGEGLSQSTSLLFSRLNGDVSINSIFALSYALSITSKPFSDDCTYFCLLLPGRKPVILTASDCKLFTWNQTQKVPKLLFYPSQQAIRTLRFHYPYSI